MTHQLTIAGLIYFIPDELKLCLKRTLLLRVTATREMFTSVKTIKQNFTIACHRYTRNFYISKNDKTLVL